MGLILWVLDGEEKAGRQAGSCCYLTPTCCTWGTVIQDLVLSWDSLNDEKWNVLKGTKPLDIPLTCVKGFQPIPSGQDRLPEPGSRAVAGSLSLQPLQDPEQHGCWLLRLMRDGRGDFASFDHLLHVVCSWVGLSLYAHCKPAQLQCTAGQEVQLRLCPRRDGGRPKGEKAELSWGWGETGCPPGHWRAGKLHKDDVSSWAEESLGSGTDSRRGISKYLLEFCWAIELMLGKAEPGGWDIKETCWTNVPPG